MGPDYNIAYLAIAIAGAMAVTASIGAISQSRAIWRAVEAIARQPEAGGRIFTSLIIGLALIETLVIYTLLVTGFMMMPRLNDMVQAKYGAEKLQVEQQIDQYEKTKGH